MLGGRTPFWQEQTSSRIRITKRQPLVETGFGVKGKRRQKIKLSNIFFSKKHIFNYSSKIYDLLRLLYLNIFILLLTLY